MQEFEEDFYAILGVDETATPEQIRKAYLKLAKKLHPDRFPNDPEQREVAQSEFSRVTRAYEVVFDAETRQEYDTLRVLSRKRDQAAAAGTVNDAVEPGHDNGSPEEPKAVESVAAQSRLQQQQTVVDDENINIKWANKHLLRADDLYRKKKYQEAETAMKEAIRLVPNEPKYHNKLAEIYFARGWKTLAMTEVQAALRIDPKDPHSKTLEAKIKAAPKSNTQSQQIVKSKPSLMEQIKSLFSGKKR